MIPFDSYKYLTGLPVVAMDGSAVSDIKHFSPNGEDLWVGLVTAKDGSQMIETFCSDELFHPEPEKYVNVYVNMNIGQLFAGDIRESIEECEKSKGQFEFVGIYKLVKVQ